jgi:hypothetical protein
MSLEDNTQNTTSQETSNQTEKTTQTVNFSTTPVPSPTKSKIAELEKLMKELIAQMLSHTKSLQHGKKEEKMLLMLAQLRALMEKVNELINGIEAKDLNSHELNKFNFLSTCAAEFDKLSNEAKLGDTHALQQNLSKLDAKLTEKHYPEILQNKENPNLINISKASKAEIQAAGKTACAEMGIEYKQTKDGFEAKISPENREDFNNLLLKNINQNQLTIKPEQNAQEQLKETASNTLNTTPTLTKTK